MDYKEKQFTTLLLTFILLGLFFGWLGDHEKKPKTQTKCNCCCTQMENKR